MQHRRDIDGLRAVAVASVVLFHAGLAGFGGGYVGVDVFFVISGYLITSIIAEDLRAGRFSIVAFYERRVRRIFPALFAMLLASSIAASVLLLPRDLHELCQSIVSATLYVSNVFFWRTSDYFGGPAHLKPLLHTWSLSVEEQFYIVLPAALLVIHRWLAGRCISWLLAAAMLSFAISVAGTLWKPVAAFYLAPARAWELLIGSLLALGAVPPVSDRLWREALAAAGLGLVVWPVTTFTDQTVFPGHGALAPCLGAGLIIHAGLGGPTIVGRALALPPVVLLGLISYSLYLWHWPLFALTRHWVAEPLSPGTIAAVLTASLIVATLSWRFVELPFRNRTLATTARPLFGAAAAASLAALAFGAFGQLAHGWPARFPDYRPIEIAGRELLREGSCFLRAGQGPAGHAGFGPCRIGPADGRRVLVWGDSFAAHLVPGLTLPDTAGLAVHQLTASACPPIPGRHFANRPRCRAFNDHALDVVRELRPDVVILSARWELYLGRAPDVAALARTIERLGALGARVVLVGQGPSFEFETSHDYVYRTGASVAGSRSGSQINAALASAGAAAFIDPMSQLCDGARCALRRDDAYLYFDNGHFTLAGSQRLRELLLPLIESVARYRSPAVGGSVQAAGLLPDAAERAQ
jgi:peptidoglycan/LPS O-acetylase OafA/YrhL